MGAHSPFQLGLSFKKCRAVRRSYPSAPVCTYVLLSKLCAGPPGRPATINSQHVHVRTFFVVFSAPLPSSPSSSSPSPFSRCVNCAHTPSRCIAVAWLAAACVTTTDNHDAAGSRQRRRVDAVRTPTPWNVGERASVCDMHVWKRRGGSLSVVDVRRPRRIARAPVLRSTCGGHHWCWWYYHLQHEQHHHHHHAFVNNMLPLAVDYEHSDEHTHAHPTVLVSIKNSA